MTGRNNPLSLRERVAEGRVREAGGCDSVGSANLPHPDPLPREREELLGTMVKK
jgi:hypothetical protein